jgi:ParB-like chromosome segregation protein Spo0J
MPQRPEPLTPAEMARIDELLAQGISQKKIAREVGRAQSTISLHCKRTGQVPTHRAPTEAIQRHSELAIERRIEHTGELMAKVLEVARKSKSGLELKNLSTAWGILIDKLNILENRPSNITESRSASGGRGWIDLEEEFAKLDSKWEQEAMQSGHPGEEYAVRDISEDV